MRVYRGRNDVSLSIGRQGEAVSPEASPLTWLDSRAGKGKSRKQLLKN